MRGDLVVALGELDRRVDDRGARLAGRGEGLLGVLDHPGRLHRVLHGAVQGAALGGEVVLELDQHNGGLLRVHGVLRVSVRAGIRARTAASDHAPPAAPQPGADDGPPPPLVVGRPRDWRQRVHSSSSSSTWRKGRPVARLRPSSQVRLSDTYASYVPAGELGRLGRRGRGGQLGVQQAAVAGEAAAAPGVRDDDAVGERGGHLDQAAVAAAHRGAGGVERPRMPSRRVTAQPGEQLLGGEVDGVQHPEGRRRLGLRPIAASSRRSPSVHDDGVADHRRSAPSDCQDRTARATRSRISA